MALCRKCGMLSSGDNCQACGRPFDKPTPDTNDDDDDDFKTKSRFNLKSGITYVVLFIIFMATMFSCKDKNITTFSHTNGKNEVFSIKSNNQDNSKIFVINRLQNDSVTFIADSEDLIILDSLLDIVNIYNTYTESTVSYGKCINVENRTQICISKDYKGEFKLDVSTMETTVTLDCTLRELKHIFNGIRLSKTK